MITDVRMDDNSQLPSITPLAKVLYERNKDDRLTMGKLPQEVYVSVCFTFDFMSILCFRKRLVYATRKETLRIVVSSIILCIMTVIGIIIVCLTAPKPEGRLLAY